MKLTKIMIMIMSIIFILSACSNSGSSSDSSSTNDTVAFATKVDLFNSLENVLKKIPEKKYPECYDSLNEILKLSNKSGYVEDLKDATTVKYINDLNTLCLDIQNESIVQKQNKVSFDYQQSQLSLLASMGGGQSSNQSDSGGSSDSGSGSSGSGGMAKSGSSESSSGEATNQQQQKQQYVIPEEEVLKQYPELALTDRDHQIYNLTVDVMGYVTKTTLDSKPDNDSAISNRLKYLFYKVRALSNMDAYDTAKDFLSEGKNTWDKLYMKLSDKEQQDILTMNSLIKNIESSLNNKNSTAVEIQCKIAIDLIGTLASKTQST